MVEFPSPHVWLPEGTLYVPLSKQGIRGKIGWPPPLMVDTLDWHAPLRKKPHLFLLSVGHALPSCKSQLDTRLLSVRRRSQIREVTQLQRGWEEGIPQGPGSPSLSPRCVVDLPMRPQNGVAVSHMEIEKTDLVLYRQHLRDEVLKTQVYSVHRTGWTWIRPYLCRSRCNVWRRVANTRQ